MKGAAVAAQVLSAEVIDEDEYKVRLIPSVGVDE
jgi:hypothetical protein